MIEVLYRLQALYQFYKSAHWLASEGKEFYSYHLLFERLYEGFDDEMDGLVELLLISEEDKQFYPDKILKGAMDYLPKFGNSASNIKEALKAEHELVGFLGKIVEGNEKPDAAGINNYLMNLAEKHSARSYLLLRAV